MASWMQYGLTFGYHISFETITSGRNEGTLCNSSKERDKILEV